MTFLFVAVLMDMVAMGITLPVLPGLVRDMLGGDVPQAAKYIGWLAALWAFARFFAGPILGSLSDRFGRRPLLLISMFGSAIDYVVMALAPTIGWLFAGRIASGVTTSSFATANAYIGDVIPEETRARQFGLLNAAFGVGLMVGPIAGGLLGSVDPRLPFWCAAALCLINGLYGLVALPESLPKARRSKLNLKLANPVGSLLLYASKPGLLSLAAIVFLYYLAQQAVHSVAVLYVVDRFAWSPAMIGLALMAVGAGIVLVQTMVLRRLVGIVGERGLLIAGLVAGAAGFAIFGWAPTSGAFWGGVPVYVFIGLLGASAQALMSRKLDTGQQGRLQGANASVVALAGVIGPVLFTTTYAHALTDWAGWAPPGAPFFLAAALVGLGLLFALGGTRASEVKSGIRASADAV